MFSPPATGAKVAFALVDLQGVSHAPGSIAGNVPFLDVTGSLLISNIPAGVEKTANKNTPNGYAGLDGSGNFAGPILFYGDLATNLASLVPATGQLYFAKDTSGTNQIGKFVIGNTNASNIPFSSLAGFGGTTGNFIIYPAANGSIQLYGTGGTTGNARGINACDFQSSRTSAAQVASGSNSAIIASKSSTASGANSFVAASSSSSATNTGAVALGVSCVAGGQYSMARGRFTQAMKTGQRAESSGDFVAAGDGQVTMTTLLGITTSVTQRELTLDGAAFAAGTDETTSNGFNCAANNSNPKVYFITLKLAAYSNNAGTPLFGRFIREFIIYADTGTVLHVVNSATPVADVTGSSWSVSVTPDAGNTRLRVLVTGDASGNSVYWYAVLDSIEIANGL